MMKKQNYRPLHIALWIAQGLLAVAFGIAGFMKITAPMEELVKIGMSFVTSYEPATVRFIGITELLAAIGLILPSALRIFPILSPLAATGLSVVMILATQYHVSHNESSVPNIILFALAAFVAWGRFRKVPVQPKV